MKPQPEYENRPIGWFCTYTPEEIIIAAGLSGRRILGRAGETARADASLHPNLCAYVRACYSAALEDDFGELAGIIGVDSCDAMRRLYDVWRTNLSPGFSHILSLPHESTPEAAEFFMFELKRLVESLGEHFGRKISAEDLRRGIETLNETRSALQGLSRLRRENSSISGKRFFEILREAMTRPKDEVNPWLRGLLEKAEGSVGSGEGIDIMLSGGVLDDVWVMGAIEEAGGRVVADDMCCGSRYYETLTSTEEEPLRAIARRYLFKAPCARMSETKERTDRLMRLIDESGARGLIYYCVKFCDPHTLDWVAVNRELQSRGIPSLRCETDYSISGRERMRTRIEAFLEMLS